MVLPTESAFCDGNHDNVRIPGKQYTEVNHYTFNTSLHIFTATVLMFPFNYKSKWFSPREARDFTMQPIGESLLPELDTSTKLQWQYSQIVLHIDAHRVSIYLTITLAGNTTYWAYQSTLNSILYRSYSWFEANCIRLLRKETSFAFECHHHTRDSHRNGRIRTTPNKACMDRWSHLLTRTGQIDRVNLQWKDKFPHTPLGAFIRP